LKSEGISFTSKIKNPCSLFANPLKKPKRTSETLAQGDTQGDKKMIIT
jgi:hypothetical protein